MVEMMKMVRILRLNLSSPYLRCLTLHVGVLRPAWNALLLLQPSLSPPCPCPVAGSLANSCCRPCEIMSIISHGRQQCFRFVVNHFKSRYHLCCHQSKHFNHISLTLYIISHHYSHTHHSLLTQTICCVILSYLVKLQCHSYIISNTPFRSPLSGI